jgi:hypothetical protein
MTRRTARVVVFDLEYQEGAELQEFPVLSASLEGVRNIGACGR